MKTNQPISKAYDGWVRVETDDGPVLVRQPQETTPPHLQREGLGRKGTLPTSTQPEYSAQFTWLETYMADAKTLAAFDKETTNE